MKACYCHPTDALLLAGGPPASGLELVCWLIGKSSLIADGVALAQMHFDRGDMLACQWAIDGANAYTA